MKQIKIGKINREFLYKWYTRIIGIYFTFIIFSLFIDFAQYGHHPETWHKIFHIIIGVIILYNWNNKNFYRPFSSINGAFFIFVAIFGFTFPEFGISEGLEAFTFLDTIIHSSVGITGLLIGIKIKK